MPKSLIAGYVEQYLGGLPPESPREAELHAELAAVEDEFGGITLEDEVGCMPVLSVETECIVLEDVDLGPFKIQLWLEDPLFSYATEAVRPNPAAGRSSCVHPHVNGNRLCAGEGLTPIRRALENWRLQDFFLLVQQVLETYSAMTAYERLERWYGEKCLACGGIYDELSQCQHCEDDCCDGCLSSCHDCDNNCCDSCLEECDQCSNVVCRSCRQACEHCDASGCADCVTMCGACGCIACTDCVEVCCDCGRPRCLDCYENCSECEQPVCNTCRAAHEEAHAEDQFDDQPEEEPEPEEETNHDNESDLAAGVIPDLPAPPDAGPAIHAAGLGQAAVPA